MYHGNDPALMALDLAEQRIKQERMNALTRSNPDLMPGLNLALRLILETADDVAPRSA